jgi:predicted amidophosphoribosyltransferase
MEMTKRAERLGKFLENEGWSVYENMKVCVKCKSQTSTFNSYCGRCGGKLVADASHRKTVNDQMEKAIKYVIGKSK